MDAPEMPLCSLVTLVTPFVSNVSSRRFVLHTARLEAMAWHAWDTCADNVNLIASFAFLIFQPSSYDSTMFFSLPLWLPTSTDDCSLRVASITAHSSSIRRFHLSACSCEWCHYRWELRQLNSRRNCLPRYWRARLHEGLHRCCQRVSSWDVDRPNTANVPA